jgi:hypothetical protein
LVRMVWVRMVWVRMVWVRMIWVRMVWVRMVWGLNFVIVGARVRSRTCRGLRVAVKGL